MDDTSSRLENFLGNIGVATPAPKRLLKVAVAVTVTIDLDDYRMNYGSDDVDTIRNDTRHAVADAARSAFADGIVAVELKGG